MNVKVKHDAYLFYIIGKNKSHLISLCVNPLFLVEYLASNFEVWIEDRLQHSTDALFRFGLNFKKLERMYILFRRSIHVGDFITIEHIWTWFLPVFILLDKQIYVEISLNQIETLYHKKSSYFE